jgi:hypothetical protein
MDYISYEMGKITVKNIDLVIKLKYSYRSKNIDLVIWLKVLLIKKIHKI